MPDEDNSKGIWKLATQLANKVTRKQAAIILILIILVYGSYTFVTTLAPSLSNTPNLLVILAVVVICVCGFVAIHAVNVVALRGTKQTGNQVPEVERVFFRNQLFEELITILNQLRSPIIIRLVITYSIWRSKSDSEKTEYLGADDFASLAAFYRKVDSRNRFYAQAVITAVQDAQYETSRLALIDDIRRLFDTIPWLTVRRSEVDWPAEQRT